MKGSSYNIVNYAQRPSKAAERKMLIEVLREFCRTSNIDCYRYIGMGSIYYTDFALFHKELGINDMISLENKTDDRKRFEFNKPFKCIILELGDSTEILPRLNWEKKSIVWLDYDETLQKYMFEDVEIVFRKLVKESFFFITCNGSFPKFIIEKDNSYNVDLFKENFGDYVPFDLCEKDLTRNGGFKLIRRMINNQVEGVLAERNAILDEDEKLVYKQLVFIKYKDNAPMVTLGGILIENKDLKDFEHQLRLKKIDFIRESDEEFSIESPLLTYKEVDLLNRNLPSSKVDFLEHEDLQFIPLESRESYFRIYRYFPYYVEVKEM